jgi:hypothetical protein
MTTVRLYESTEVSSYFRARWGRKHAMPRGRGQKAWRLSRTRVRIKPGATVFKNMSARDIRMAEKSGTPR